MGGLGFASSELRFGMGNSAREFAGGFAFELASRHELVA